MANKRSSQRSRGPNQFRSEVSSFLADLDELAGELGPPASPPAQAVEIPPPPPPEPAAGAELPTLGATPGSTGEHADDASAPAPGGPPITEPAGAETFDLDGGRAILPPPATNEVVWAAPSRQAERMVGGAPTEVASSELEDGGAETSGSGSEPNRQGLDIDAGGPALADESQNPAALPSPSPRLADPVPRPAYPETGGRRADDAVSADPWRVQRWRDADLGTAAAAPAHWPDPPPEPPDWPAAPPRFAVEPPDRGSPGGGETGGTIAREPHRWPSSPTPPVVGFSAAAAATATLAPRSSRPWSLAAAMEPLPPLAPPPARPSTPARAEDEETAETIIGRSRNGVSPWVFIVVTLLAVVMTVVVLVVVLHR